MGQTFNAILRMIAASLADTQCGSRHSAARARGNFLTAKTGRLCIRRGSAPAGGSASGFVIEDMPVQWSNATGSKVRIVRDSIRMLCDAMRVRRLVARTLSGRNAAN